MPRKRKQGKKQAPKPKQHKQRKTYVRGSSKRAVARMDSGALAYAKLLRDPCNAALTGFYGGTAGYVQRFTSTFSVGTTAGTTAGVFVYAPGNGNILGGADVANESSAVTVNYSDATAPGSGFLRSSAKSARVLACCVKLFTNASEANRSGYVFFGNCSVAECPPSAAAGPTPAQIETMVPVSVRTPADNVEVKWFPGTGDADYVAIDGGQVNNHVNQAIIVGWSGQPAGVGFKVVVTAVIEWLPANNQGLSEDAFRPPTSLATLPQIKAALYGSDAGWWYKAGMVAVKLAKAALAGTSVSPMGMVVSGLKALAM